MTWQEQIAKEFNGQVVEGGGFYSVWIELPLGKGVLMVRDIENHFDVVHIPDLQDPPIPTEELGTADSYDELVKLVNLQISLKG